MVLGKEVPKNEQISSMYMDAIAEIHIRKNIKNAAIILAKILKTDSTHAPSHSALSSLLSSSTESLRHSQYAYKYDTTNIWYQTQLVKKYVENKMYDKAIDIAEISLSQNPSEADSYTNIIDIYVTNKDYEMAEKKIDSFEAKFGKSNESMIYRAQIYDDILPSDTLLIKLNKLEKAHPNSAIPAIIIGEVYMQLKNPDKALEYYKKAEVIEEENTKLIVLFADYYLRIGDVDNLIKYTKKAYAIKELALEPKISFAKEVLFTSFFYTNYMLKITDLIFTLQKYHPNNLEVNDLVSQHYVNMGLIEDSYKQHKFAIENGFANQTTYYNIISIKSYQKKFDEVIDYCNKMSLIYPETKQLNIMQKSYAYMAMKKHEKAIDILNKELHDITDRKIKSDYYGLIGDIYYDWGDSSKCYKNYDKSLKYNKDNYSVLNNYSYYLSTENQQLKKALKMIERVVKAEPNEATYLDTFGWVLYQLGEYEYAVTILKKAVDANTDKSHTIFMHYGDALKKIGKTATAKLYWLKAKENGASEKDIIERLKQK